MTMSSDSLGALRNNSGRWRSGVSSGPFLFCGLAWLERDADGFYFGVVVDDFGAHFAADA